MVTSDSIDEEADQGMEMIPAPATSPVAPPELGGSEEIAPLLAKADKSKFNIFSVSYPRRKPRENVASFIESETSLFFSQFMLWTWSGSRYSGMLCMALSATTYFIMGVVSNIFSAQSIPLLESASARCLILSILSYIWMRRTGQPIFGPPHVRKLLAARALMGYLSLLSFVFCVQTLPLSQAVSLSFTTPIMASILARFILNEKMKLGEIGGLACSFFGVLLTSKPFLTVQDTKAGDANDTYTNESHHIYAILGSLFTSVTAGISYCLIRSGAKASDQPLVTVFSFSILASPAAAICTLAFQDFVRPGFYSLLLMVVLGSLAFFAEVFLARGLHLEKTSKVVNVQYIEVALLQLWSIGSSQEIPTFGSLFGCLLILTSVLCTMYFGLDKETE